MKKVTLKDWDLFSSRHNSKNYTSKDKKLILKTAPEEEGASLEEFIQEKEASIKALSLGIPTPKVFDVVEIEEGGIGLIYEYIENKRSISRAISEDFSTLDKNIKIFSDMGKLIHNIQCDTAKYQPVEDNIYGYLSKTSLLTDNQKNVVRKFLDSVEKTTNCLHGDYQMGNVIVSPKGNYAIDIGTICYGNPLYDIGFWYIFSHYDHRNCMCEHFFHMPRERVLECFDVFLKYYYGMTDEKEKKAFEDKVKPYAMSMMFFHGFLRDMEEYIKGALDWGYEDCFKEYI